MSDPFFLLALPSAVILVALVAHSLRVLPRRRAIAFWLCVVAYGVLRAGAVRLITVGALDASVPYVFHDRGPALFGVSLQEVTGWAIVTYLAWWFGCRLARCTDAQSPSLFLQAAWACVFLAAASWAVETAAATAGWWHWTVPASYEILGPVPGIGLLDWSLVGVDFLLPFLAWTAPSLRGSRLRWIFLLAFPLHFVSHLDPAGDGIALFSIVHGALIVTIVALALFAHRTDDAFARESARVSWIPTASILTMVAALAFAIAGSGGRPDLLAPLTPLFATTLRTRRAWQGVAIGGAFVGLALIDPRFAFGAVLSMTAIVLGWAGCGSGLRRVAVVAVVAAAVFVTPLSIARSEARLREGLDQAIAARDRGDLRQAERWLSHLAHSGPRSHVPFVLLGEIRYRMHDPEGARAAFAEAVSIQPTFVAGYRHLVVIELQSDQRSAAVEHARRGLLVKPDDIELAYLEQRARGQVAPSLWERAVAEGPDAASTIASLAFEVGDAAGAAQVLDLALARWPRDSALDAKRARVQLAVSKR